MDNTEQLIDHLNTQGILPLFYHADPEVCLEVTRALYAGGIRSIEFTNRGEHALRNFKAMLALRDEALPGLLLGAGTIRSADQAGKFIDAGAQFLVSPVFDADVADVAYIQKIPWIPGCMTPTEIHEAAKSGCTIVKLFPGHLLGPGFVTAVSELFPDIQFMPTGGVEVEAENMNAWFNAGVCAVGLGSKLITRLMLEQQDYAGITALTRKAMDIVKQYRE